jgi:hypothetical protein
MLSREQAQALTRCVHMLRPAWNEEGIYAALRQVANRDPFEVALAAIRAAKDQSARTPGVIPAGPHWNELPPTAPKPPTLSRAERRARTCDNCGRLDGCTPSCPGFTPLAHATQHRSQAPTGLRTHIQPTVTFSTEETA